MTSSADPLRHFFWEELTPRAAAVVATEAARIYAELEQLGFWGPTNCGEACARWTAAFAAAGVPVEQIEGNYFPGDADVLLDLPTSSEHVWLLVDGHLVDPTAGQFLGPSTDRIELDAYRS